MVGLTNFGNEVAGLAEFGNVLSLPKKLGRLSQCFRDRAFRRWRIIVFRRLRLIAANK
jgi:hypothetical protein